MKFVFGPVVSAKAFKMLTDTRAFVYLQLTCEPLAQVSCNNLKCIDGSEI